MTHPNVLNLKRIDMSEVVINELGKEWCSWGLDLYEAQLKEFYGEIPVPEAAIEDDLTLCMFWECDGHPIVIRLDDTHWDYARDPLLPKGNHD